MSIASPAAAQPRTDLPYLRHRRRPPTSPADPAIAEFVRGAASRASTSTPVSRPEAAPQRPEPASLDLSVTPAAAPPPFRPRQSPTSSSLDPSAPAPATAPAPRPLASPNSSSLDLSEPQQRPTSALQDAPARPVTHSAQPLTARPRLPRTRLGAPTLLTDKSPTVTLTRLQSGVGALTVEAACSSAVGDLRLGCAYQLRTGVTSVVQHASGLTVGPPQSKRPVIRSDREQFERLTLDLVQVRDLERLLIYAFSDSGAVLQWGGTLVTSTSGHARIKTAMDRPAQAGVLALLTVFNIAGELVVRSESELIAGSVRDTCLAYGYERIAWLDARTPLT